MQTDIHHSHTNTPPSRAGSLTASCSNSGPGSAPYTHVSLSNQGSVSLLVLRSSILFMSPPLPSLSPLFQLFFRWIPPPRCCSSPSLLVWFRQRWAEALRSSPSSFPLLESRCESRGFLRSSSSSLPPSPSLSLRFSQRSLREAAPLSSLPFILFLLPTWFLSLSLSLCLRPPPASVSL